MKDTGTPVLILFILTIAVLLYKFVDQFMDVHADLRDTVYEQQHVIDQKIEENKALSRLVMYMYRSQTGQDLPVGWDDGLKSQDTSPVH